MGYVKNYMMEQEERMFQDLLVAATRAEDAMEDFLNRMPANMAETELNKAYEHLAEIIIRIKKP